MRSRLMPVLAALLIVGNGTLAFPPVPPPKKNDKAGLDGTWKVVGYTYVSPKATRTTSPYSKVVIKDGKWKQVRTAGTKEGPVYSYKLDPTKAPPWIDMRSMGKATTGARRGVYHLKGDRLTVTYTLRAKPRPTTVDGEPTVGQYRWVLQREKP